MQDLVIQKLDGAKRMLAEAKTLQEAKKVLDMATAAAIYAKRQHLGEEAISYAHDIKVLALQLLGNMLKSTKRNTGGDAQRTRFQKGRESPPTIKELGLDYKTSMLARRVAGAYCAFCNGLVVAGHCFMSGRILSCYWSKIKDCTGKADLIVLRKDGIEVSVGLTMDSAESKLFEQRKMAKSARNGQKWPDRMLYLDRVTHRDEASNMAWYRQEDIEPILTWSKEQAL